MSQWYLLISSDSKSIADPESSMIRVRTEKHSVEPEWRAALSQSEPAESTPEEKDTPA